MAPPEKPGPLPARATATTRTAASATRWVSRHATRWAAAGLFCLGCGDGDHAPLLEVQPTRYQAETCVPAEPVDLFFEWDALADATYYECLPPHEGEGAMSFISATGTESTVTGASADFAFEWPTGIDTTDRQLVIWEGNRSGFFTLPFDSVSSPLELDVRVKTDIPTGTYTLAAAISEGLETDESGRPVIGTIAAASVYVIAVGSGDVQVHLQWDTTADLDVWVEDPSGVRTWWADRRSDNGGILDLDSYPDCRGMSDFGRGNENIYWLPGTAARGQYDVYVDMYSDCGTFPDTATHFKVDALTADGTQLREVLVTSFTF